MMGLGAGNAIAAEGKTPNILFIMGDDIGIMNVGAYHRGIMVGETPNIDHNDPAETGKPFFVYYNPARMHITTMFSPKYEAMLGAKGGKDWGINEVGMKQLDDNVGGALAAPSTAYLYDWNLLPIGQALWMKELMTYKKFPSLQAPASYNLDQVIAARKDARHISHTGDKPESMVCDVMKAGAWQGAPGHVGTNICFRRAFL
jgi:hypothetical protein